MCTRFLAVVQRCAQARLDAWQPGFAKSLVDALAQRIPAGAVSIEDLAVKTDNNRARIVANALNDANSRYLENNKSPSRKVNEHDNRGSHYYVAMYWAEALAANTADEELAAKFSAAATAVPRTV